MKNLLCMLLLVVAMVVSPDGRARPGVPIQSPQHADFIVAPEKTPSIQKVRESIGLVANAHGWQVTAEQPGQMTLHTLIRNKHDIVVNVHYDTRGVSIEYVSSQNLKYEMEGGVAYIHPNYNRWVEMLVHDIVAKVST